MKILAVNAGSSSLKFQLLEMPEETVITTGIVERIGLNESIFTITVNGEKRSEVTDIPDHAIAVQMLLEVLVDLRIVKHLDEIMGVGHRVVHGGEEFSESVLIDQNVLDVIESLSDLAPLHNPANITGIKAFQAVLPNVPQVAVFDTAFHQTMSKEAYIYPVPYSWYGDFHIRKYGFHGTSHQYVSIRAAELIGKPLEETNFITVHIGNGGSITAVQGGKSIDTSMGFTPLAGIMMGTRSGDIDPTIIPHVMKKGNLELSQVINQLNKASGLKGVSGRTSDMRDVLAGVDEGDEQCKLALDLFVKRVCDFIGSYYIALGDCDAIIFTAGIGENSAPTREAIVSRLKALGIKLDQDANRVRGEEQLISTPDSKIKVYIIPTNEEVMIARDTLSFVHDSN